MSALAWLDLGARALAATLILLATAVAATHWAVQRRYLSPFSWWSRTVRSLSDPALRPLEQRLLRTGANPSDASWWLVGAAAVAGLAVLGAVRWAISLGYSVTVLSGAPPLTIARVALCWAIGLLQGAIVVRMVATWLGASPYAGWMRLLAKLTDWLILPIRRRLPMSGPVDLSPAVAYLILLLLRTLIG